MARLCETHNLVLAHDGKCVLCRRQSARYVNLQPRQKTAADQVITAILGFGVLAAAGMLVWAIQITQDKSRVGAAQASASHTAAQLQRNPGDTGTPTAEIPPAPPPVTLAATADTTQDEPVIHAEAPSEAVRAARAKKALRAAQKSVEERKRAIPISMYSTSWCTICETSRYYLMGRELTYSEHDIERDPQAKKQLERVNKMQSVPTFVIGDEVLVGFNAWQIEGALEDAAKRQLAKETGAACTAEAPCQAAASRPNPPTR